MKKISSRAENVLDDPQLLIYARGANEDPVAAHLPGRTVEQAEWISLKAKINEDDDKQVRSHPVEDMPELMQQFSVQIAQDLKELWARKPMQAFAPDSVCQYCDARGICRKGMW
jgi:ATP-dependent helicase/nuclease subunit B